MSCYPEPYRHIRHKVKAVWDLTSYASKKELKHATDIDTSDLATKKILLLSQLNLKNWILINWLMFQLVWLI